MGKYEKAFLWDSCPNCGDSLIVSTDCSPDDDTEDETWLNDSDEVKCADDCGFISAVSVDENGIWIQDGNIDELSE